MRPCAIDVASRRPGERRDRWEVQRTSQSGMGDGGLGDIAMAKRVVVDSEFAFGAGPALDVEGTRRHDPAGTSAGCGARRGERERGGGRERERETKNLTFSSIFHRLQLGGTWGRPADPTSRAPP